MTVRTKPPFRADHVGSFLRPKALLDAREQNRDGNLSRAELCKVEDTAIRDVVRFQEDLGLHGITDGEFRRTYFHSAATIRMSYRAAVFRAEGKDRRARTRQHQVR